MPERRGRSRSEAMAAAPKRRCSCPMSRSGSGLWVTSRRPQQVWTSSGRSSFVLTTTMSHARRNNRNRCSMRIAAEPSPSTQE